MTLSRWKIMAVGLGVSLGGLAAIAGQCPKDVTKSSPTADAPPTLEAPVIPVAASAPGAAPKAVPPATAPMPDLPPIPGGTLPSLPTAPATEPVKLPDTPVSSPAMPPVIPIGGTEPTKVAPALPDLPGLPGKPMPPATPPAPPAPTGDPSTPRIPAGDIPKPLNEPSAPPAGITYPKPTPPSPATGSADPLIGVPTPKPSPGSTLPSNRAPEIPVFDPPPPPPMKVVVPDGGTVSTTAKHAQLATKFRILLRVGEGEPTFEVRCGDDLVLKVACEKVDIKSPEKGNGPSAVKACGKVRFAGFGAEGTCDELSFLAGSGEVVLAGGVNIKVKDKLGRVESELSADSAKYKLDPCPTGSPR